jgi:hypothetical protein
MPFLISLIAVVGVAYFWLYRARNAVDAAGDILDAANNVRLAARRFGFKRRTNRHPVDDIDEPNVAIAAIATAFIELDNLPTKEHRDRLAIQLQSTFNLDLAAGDEIMILARWLMNQCGGPTPTISRISRRLYKFDNVQSVTTLMTILKSLGGGTFSDSQRDALEDITRAFHL